MQRDCDVCGTTYEAKRASSRYCSSVCRTRASRKGIAGPAPVVELTPAAPRPSGGVTEATVAELSAVGAMESSAGRRALVLAGLLDDPPPMSLGAVAGWSREHGAAMVQALASGTGVVSAVDELRARRRAKRGA